MDFIGCMLMRPKKKSVTKRILPKTYPKRYLKNPSTARVVVLREKTPSGQRYDFQPGEQQPVNADDFNYLLSLERKGGGGCCGSSGSTSSSYFEEV